MKQRTTIMILALALGSIGSGVTAQSIGAAARGPEKQSATARPDTAPNDRKQALLARVTELEAQRKATLARLDRSLAETQKVEKALRAEERRVARGAAPRSRLRPLQTRMARGQASVDTARRQLAQNTYQLNRLRNQLQQEEGPGDHLSSLLRQALAGRDTAASPMPEDDAAGSVSLPSGGREPDAYGHALTPALRVGSAWEGMLAHAVAEERQAAADLRTAEARLQAVEEKLSTTKQRVQAGLAPAGVVLALGAEAVSAKSTVETTRYRLEQMQQQRQKAARLVTLQRPIDVELRNATVRDAAQSISQASGLTVEVGPGVSPATRLTVVARGVPMATILDSIARQSALLIHPHENGVLLKPAPSLEVNGQRTDFMSPFAPWSSDWGMNPSASVGYGGFRTQLGTALLETRPGLSPGTRLQTAPAAGSAGSAFDPSRRGSTPPAVAAPGAPSGSTGAARGLPGGAAPAPVAPPGTSPTRAPGYLPPGTRVTVPRVYLDSRGRAVYEPMAGRSLRVLTPDGSAGPVAVTALSENSFVIAHPSTMPGGEPAVLLTVYRLAGEQLRPVSTTLHRLGPVAPNVPPGSYRVRPRSSAPAPAQPKAGNVPGWSPSRDRPAVR